eukprot:TRINITY_DN4691_c0_g2_i1.p1 TRINITY_DN4691_c0_g2~~TRINITY_DN4691_c0_g2_i1.p1  ORF type:complete len:368 (-),score=34.34 TRINITY_DN4691_c0_g2_i1:307-1410(-)
MIRKLKRQMYWDFFIKEILFGFVCYALVQQGLAQSEQGSFRIQTLSITPDQIQQICQDNNRTQQGQQNQQTLENGLTSQESVFKLVEDEQYLDLVEPQQYGNPTPVADNEIDSKTSQECAIDIWNYFPEELTRYIDFLNNEMGGFEFFNTYATDGCLDSVNEESRDGFSSLGQIRISLDNGDQRYCVGNILSDEVIITVQQCIPNNSDLGNMSIEFQPRIYVKMDRWWKVKEIQHLEEAKIDRSANFVILVLETQLEIGIESVKLKQAPSIPLQGCNITLQGWSQDNEYYMASCPGIRDIRLFLQLNTCGVETCDIRDFRNGSPIYLSCERAGSVSNFLIGMKFHEDFPNDAFFFNENAYAYLYNLL